MTLDPVAKIFLFIGVSFIVLAVAWQLGWIQNLKLGRLPGDIAIEKENMRFYFPITTGILLSVLVTFISWAFRK